LASSTSLLDHRWLETSWKKERRRSKTR
jgi:hypothetical protein